jgi:predicted lipid-binding transport protein (Tim44 family)
MTRLRPLLGLLAVSAALLLVAADGAQARAGGGSSFGSRGARTYSAPAATRTAPDTAAPIQRSVTQPGQSTAGTATQPGGFFNRPGMGLFGGLAAGFLGAGLLGMLFGHGFLGGLGGFASILGLLLQIALVVVVGRLLWSWWQRRTAPAAAVAAAGGPMLRDFGLNEAATRPAAGGASPVGAAVQIVQADYDAFERLLGEIQGAYGREDLNALRARVTPEMLSYFADDLAGNASRGVVNEVSGVKLLQGDLAEAWREGDAEYATVALRFSLLDRYVDRANGRVIEGGDGPQEATELWTFRRARGGNWILSAIQQT